MAKMPGFWIAILDKVGLVGAGGVDGRGLGSLLAGAAEREVGAAEKGTENAHGEL